MGRIRGMRSSAFRMGQAVRHMPNAPFATAGMVGGGLAALGMLGVGSAVGQAFGGQDQRQADWQREMGQLESQLYAKMMDKQRQQQVVETQLQSLAAVSPQLYNQIAAGRRLPQGAVRIGGPRRDDLLQQVAMRMADGSLGTTP